MKDIYKIIKSTSVFPWQKVEVWVRGDVTYLNRYGERVTENKTRCIHKTSTEQKAQGYIDYWEEVANFRGENNEG